MRAPSPQLGLFGVPPRPPRELFEGDDARFSPDRLFRYLLWRRWDDLPAPSWPGGPERPLLGFLLHNPSKADEEGPDMTTAKCKGFGKRAGAAGVVLANFAARVETSPERLAEMEAAGEDIVGPENARYLAEAFARCGSVVVAFGSGPLVRRYAPAALALVPAGVTLSCYGLTRDGAPRHPSRLGYDTQRVPFDRAWAAGVAK